MPDSKEPSPEETQELLERIGNGDESALRELHDKYARRIFSFAMSRLRDETAAQTVMVDTLFEVWKKPQSFRGESRFSTWLLGIAKYKVLNTLRSADRPHEDIDDYAESIADPDADIDANLESADDARMLRECMDRLNEVQRECVQLVYVEGLALSEVSEVQDVPEGTVKTRLFHARKNLKQCVQRLIGSSTQ